MHRLLNLDITQKKTERTDKPWDPITLDVPEELVKENSEVADEENCKVAMKVKGFVYAGVYKLSHDPKGSYLYLGNPTPNQSWQLHWRIRWHPKEGGGVN